MSLRGRVAVVTPRPERRSSIGAWAPLLKAQADLHLCESPSDDAVLVADLVVVDEDCPQLDGWLSRASSEGRAPESIVLFSTGEGTHHGSVAWGMDGEEVLSIISDRLDRRDLLRESDRFLDDLRASNERLDGHRQRFAGLVLEQSEALRGANATLSREVDRLTRLQALARFFTAPGTDDDSFEDRLAEVVAGVLGAAGTAVLVRADDGEWSVAGRWKIARRNALGALPEDPRHPRGDRPSTRKGTTGWWIPEEGDPRAGIVALVRDGRDPAEELGGFEALREMLSDGLRTRAVTRADTSRRAQSERILETLRSGVLKVDAAARVTFANPALAEILRVPVEELENASTERIFPRDAHVLAFLRRVLENGDSIDDLETWITCSLGRRVPVTFRATPVGDPSRPDGALVLVSDLSRRKEVEAEVRRADRLAALGRLSAGVAHEIRNPLTGIRTTAELLRTRVGSADLVRFVDVILEETSRLDRIVGSLLQFAKPPSPQRVPLPLVALLERAGQLAAGRAAEQGVSLVLDAAADLPEPLADRDQMLQVLLNLLINGIEATPAGGRVALAARAVREDGRDEIHLIVEDDGEGVPPAIRERVFDPFFTTKPGGTGLGLSISQNILRQHHGQLRLERHPSGRNRAIAVLPLGPTPPGTGGEPWRTS